QRVAAIAQLLDSLPDVAAEQLSELLQTAEGFLQPLEVGLGDVAQPVTLALGGGADRRADVAQRLARLQQETGGDIAQRLGQVVAQPLQLAAEEGVVEAEAT